MTDKELQAHLTYWQKVLRLQDWEISVRFVRIQEMDNTVHFGNAQYCATDKIARIKLLVESDFDPNATIIPYDAEKTLVHELLYLHVWSFMPEKKDAVFCDAELSLNLIAGALLSARHNG